MKNLYYILGDIDHKILVAFFNRALETNIKFEVILDYETYKNSEDFFNDLYDNMNIEANVYEYPMKYLVNAKNKSILMTVSDYKLIYADVNKMCFMHEINCLGFTENELYIIHDF